MHNRDHSPTNTPALTSAPTRSTVHELQNHHRQKWEAEQHRLAAATSQSSQQNRGASAAQPPRPLSSSHPSHTQHDSVDDIDSARMVDWVVGDNELERLAFQRATNGANTMSGSYGSAFGGFSSVGAGLGMAGPRSVGSVGGPSGAFERIERRRAAANAGPLTAPPYMNDDRLGGDYFSLEKASWTRSGISSSASTGQKGTFYYLTSMFVVADGPSADILGPQFHLPLGSPLDPKAASFNPTPSSAPLSTFSNPNDAAHLRNAIRARQTTPGFLYREGGSSPSQQQSIPPANLIPDLSSSTLLQRREQGRLRAAGATGGAPSYDPMGMDADVELPFEMSDLEMAAAAGSRSYGGVGSSSSFTRMMMFGGNGNPDDDLGGSPGKRGGTPTGGVNGSSPISIGMHGLPSGASPSRSSGQGHSGHHQVTGQPSPALQPGAVSAGGMFGASSWGPSSFASSFGGQSSSLSSDEGLGAMAARYGAQLEQGGPQQGVALQQQQQPQQSQQSQEVRDRKTSARGRDQAVQGLVKEVADDGCPILKVPRKTIWGEEAGMMSIPHRVWKKGGTEKADSRHFMVMSYNVLAPMYCTDSRYHTTEDRYLNWEYRKRKILDEIAFYAPDFVSLQELPPADFKDVFLAQLSKIGYEGHFQAKKKEHAADGCAIFYLEAKFNLLAVQAFAYCDQINSDAQSDLHSRLAPFPNIALVCIFQNRMARSLRVRIVNTHLHWDPACADTKLLQAAILMEWLERTHRDVPTIIAADLNSRAGEAVVDYLVRGKVAPGTLFTDKDFGRFTASLVTRVPGGGLIPAALASSMHPQLPHPSLSGAGTPSGAGNVMPAPPLPLLRHGTKLASAYDRKDLPFTNRTPDFEGSIDHILYTSGTLSIRDVLTDLDASCTLKPLPPRPYAAYGHAIPFPIHINLAAPPGYQPPTGLVPVLPPGMVMQAQPGTLAPPQIQAGDGSDRSSPERNRDDDDVSDSSANADAAIPSAAVVASPAQQSGDDDSKPADGVLTTIAPASAPQAPTLIPYYPPVIPYHHGHLVGRVPTFPEEHFPSDHLPLIAWLKWKTVPVGTGGALAANNGGGAGVDKIGAAAGRVGGGSNRRSGPLGAPSLGAIYAGQVPGHAGGGLHGLSTSAPVGRAGVGNYFGGAGLPGHGGFGGQGLTPQQIAQVHMLQAQQLQFGDRRK
ncbi:Glucose-repressible alcohol dehydrogenase transcriptional effector [Irineochytrium annulatum]|nr:Glucose-repressible alcohol dehydrogenase transcriptional effector [Irineochytrium annulatum]